MTGTRKHPDCGKRVEIPAYADMWMRGARFGTIERVIVRSNRRTLSAADAHDIYRVRLDHPQARGLYGYIDQDCRVIAA